MDFKVRLICGDFITTKEHGFASDPHLPDDDKIIVTHLDSKLPECANFTEWSLFSDTNLFITDVLL